MRNIFKNYYNVYYEADIADKEAPFNRCNGSAVLGIWKWEVPNVNTFSETIYEMNKGNIKNICVLRITKV